MSHLLGESEFLDRLGSFPTPDNRHAWASRHGLSHGAGASAIRLVLEFSHRPIPDHHRRLSNRLFILAARTRANVHAYPTVWNIALRRLDTLRSVDPFHNDMVRRQYNLVSTESKNLPGNLELVGFKLRIPHRFALGLHERIGHRA